MTAFKTRAQHCPSCGRLIDALTGVGHEHAPSPGDYTVCFYCGTVMRFVEPLPSVRLATKADFEAESDVDFLITILRVCQHIEQRAWLKASLN